MSAAHQCALDAAIPRSTATGPWTPAEDAVLRARYVTEGAAAMALALGRTIDAVHRRTQRLKLYTHKRWGAADDRRLKMLWGDMTMGYVAKAMGRTEASCYWRAGRLGFDRGLQQGTEYVRQAAQRTGFDSVTLCKILEWHGVKPQRTMSRQIRGASYRTRAVDPLDVDDAIAAWMQAECVNEAARRRGMYGETLTAWLQQSGVPMPPRPGGKRRWRVPSETIDRVIVERNTRESVMSGARRIGMGRGTLSKRLLAAGVPRGTAHYWYVPKTAIDAVARRARAA